MGRNYVVSRCFTRADGNRLATTAKTSTGREGREEAKQKNQQGRSANAFQEQITDSQRRALMAVELMGDPDVKSTAETVDSSVDSQGHSDSDIACRCSPQ